MIVITSVAVLAVALVGAELTLRSLAFSNANCTRTKKKLKEVMEEKKTITAVGNIWFNKAEKLAQEIEKLRKKIDTPGRRKKKAVGIPTSGLPCQPISDSRITRLQPTARTPSNQARVRRALDPVGLPLLTSQLSLPISYPTASKQVRIPRRMA